MCHNILKSADLKVQKQDSPEDKATRETKSPQWSCVRARVFVNTKKEVNSRREIHHLERERMPPPGLHWTASRTPREYVRHRDYDASLYPAQTRFFCVVRFYFSLETLSLDFNFCCKSTPCFSVISRRRLVLSQASPSFSFSLSCATCLSVSLSVWYAFRLSECYALLLFFFLLFLYVVNILDGKWRNKDNRFSRLIRAYDPEIRTVIYRRRCSID